MPILTRSDHDGDRRSNLMSVEIFGVFDVRRGMFSLREVTGLRPSEQLVVGDIVDIGTWWVGWHVIVSCVRISSRRH